MLPEQRPARNKNRRTAERGNAMLESALILGVFLMMLIAILDFGQIMFVHATLAERARFAARQAILTSGCGETCVKNLVLYRSTTAGSSPDVTLVDLTADNVHVTLPTANSANGRVTITISGYRFIVVSPFIWRADSVAMRSITATSPIENPYSVTN